ncbi:hypothetical protein IMSAG025_00845 [Muribaculaceae bacterium]|nr:hypothetical protein IMSAG025_00845 [Muribaculaceae bacterium]
MPETHHDHSAGTEKNGETPACKEVFPLLCHFVYGYEQKQQRRREYPILSGTQSKHYNNRKKCKIECCDDSKQTLYPAPSHIRKHISKYSGQHAHLQQGIGRDA